MTMMIRINLKQNIEPSAFTLSEASLLSQSLEFSAVALPNFFRQIQKTHQNEVAATVAQVQSTIVA